MDALEVITLETGFLLVGYRESLNLIQKKPGFSVSIGWVSRVSQFNPKETRFLGFYWLGIESLSI
jgi:hypothetical protein